MSEMMQWVKYSNSLGFNFNGRARRREFWWNYLFYCLLGILVGVVSGVITGVAIAFEVDMIAWIGNGISMLASIFVVIKMLPLTVRRFHDTGKSGWIYLLCILGSACCGIGSIVALVFLILDSTPGDNAYGPNPKGINGGMNGMNGVGGMNNMNTMYNAMNGMNNGYNNGMNNGMNNGYNNQNWQ